MAFALKERRKSSGRAGLLRHRFRGIRFRAFGGRMNNHGIGEKDGIRNDDSLPA